MREKSLQIRSGNKLTKDKQKLNSSLNPTTEYEGHQKKKKKLRVLKS